MALVALLNHAYTKHYAIPFLNTRVTKVQSQLTFFHKIGSHGNVPWNIGKRGQDRSPAPKTISFREKIAKISPTDAEIIVLREIIKKQKTKKKEITEGKIYSPVKNLAERAKKGQIQSLPFGEKNAKISQVDPEIIGLKWIFKKRKF